MGGGAPFAYFAYNVTRTTFRFDEHGRETTNIMGPKRIPLVAGNWKMNFDHLEATYFVQQLAWNLRSIHFDYKRCEIALMPSFTSLRSVQVAVESDNLKIRYGAQAVSVTSQGAFTGDRLRRYDRPSRLLVRDRRPFGTTPNTIPKTTRTSSTR